MSGKPQPSAIEETFPTEVSAALETWLFTPPTHSLAKAKARLKSEFGIDRGLTALHHFYHRAKARRTERNQFSEYLKEARAQAQATIDSGAAPTLLLEASLVQIGALLMEATKVGKLIPEDVAQIKDLFTSLTAGVREMRGNEQLTFERERFQKSQQTKIQAGLDAIAAEAGDNPKVKAALDQIAEATRA